MPGPIEIAVVILVLVLLFGRNKISDLMGDVAKGIKSFKKGMSDDDKGEEPKIIEQGGDVSMSQETEKDKDNVG